MKYSFEIRFRFNQPRLPLEIFLGHIEHGNAVVAQALEKNGFRNAPRIPRPLPSIAAPSRYRLAPPESALRPRPFRRHVQCRKPGVGTADYQITHESSVDQ